MTWPRRFLALSAAQAILLVVTALPPIRTDFGVPTWHHNLSLGLVLLYVAAHGKRFWTDRRLAARGVAASTMLALASAFLILYLKAELKETGFKDWAKAWHVAWSWLSIAFFASHTWINRHGFVRSFKAMRRPLLAYGLPVLAVLVAIPLTWSPWGARTFVDANYIPMTLVTWLIVVAPSYGLWIAARVRERAGQAWLWATRARFQPFVDRWLLAATILANLTGFPILYFATKDTDLKYVAKYWHTWPSIVMAVLVFAHTTQFWWGMRRHWGPRTKPSAGENPTPNVMSKSP